ncbi:MAG: response regulator transcription factor [Desulfomonilaceae bacterium]|nr:response regulator transcription factor [Desulfomonilaceae bacterium]
MVGAKVLIVEDHPIFRMGLKQLINQESELEVCGEADDVAGARKAIAAIEPDIAIVDLSLNNSNGMDLIKELSCRDKQIPVVVLSMHDEKIYAERCLQAGAKGYIMKQEASLAVVKAIRTVLSGNCYVSEKVMTQVISRLQGDNDPAGSSPLAVLTDRELEVFQLVGRGLTSGDIARRLNISVKTVGTYRERIKDKLGFKRCGELVRLAVLWTENQDRAKPE